ncbi:MAG TPA: gephyrin-like molybdotransferase Glp [Macromonas sp.]|nr:gephyrin-like molybdotransferase Glp [Macromonas sp.]
MADMPSAKPGLLPLDEALQALLASVAPLDRQERVSTFDADGRVLAQALVAGLNVPAYDNSAMDGYAVRVADVVAALAAGQALPVSQRVPAGHTPEPLQPGTVARIFTGAPVPPGADAVVMQEDTEPAGERDGWPWVSFRQPPKTEQNIRRTGEDVQRGSTVLAAGTRLGPAELGLAASLGYAELPVTVRPRVALLSTGDELVMPGAMPPEQLPPGAVYNSNRFFLRTLLQRLGCEVTDLGIVPDDRAATEQALAAAAQGHDLILSSGGVSVGEEDHIKPAVQALGELKLWQIAIKPGKPFACGWIRRAASSGPAQEHCHFVGLPGNPVSSFVTFLLLVRPLVLRLQGLRGPQADGLPPALALQAHFSVPKADKRREFLRVRRNAAGGLDLFEHQGSGVLTSMVWADGLVDKPAGATIGAGDTVAYLPFDGLLG